MKQYLFVVPAIALVGAAPPPPPAPIVSQANVISPVPETCQTIGNIAGGPESPPPMRRLGELPGGQTYMAVYRTDANGCIDPMLASERQGLGSGQR